MKILQLCHKPPIPPVDGGCIAINNVTQGLLKSGHQVKVVAISTPKHPVKWSEFSEEYLQKTQFESVYIDTAINNISAIKSLLLGTSYHITRFVSKELIQKLTHILKKENFDIVQLESIFVAPYIQIIRQHSKAKIILRTHNIEHQIWERIVQNEKWWTKKWFL
ncbi:MAG: glycosyltransferase, partial [Bacteroidales bacterium]